MNFLVKLIGTFFYTGFFPIAPATFASFVFLLLYALLPNGEVLASPLVVLATLIASIPISTKLEREYGHDPGCVVIDEIVGLQVILIWAEPTALGLVAVFFLFRLFDIWKPFPAGLAQKLPRGWGIVIDDFIAGIDARIVLTILAAFFSVFGNF